MDGALLLAGWDLLSSPVDRTTNVLYALAVDDSNGFVHKADVRLALDRSLLPALPADVAAASTLAAWGTSPEAQASQEAMMRMLDG